MAKKKKTSLKPVARGFATTSVPKKIVPVEESEAEEPTQESVPDGAQITASSEVEAAQSQSELPKPRADDDFDLDKVEEQSLQNLVDKFQAKTEREVTRMIKLVEQERRFAKTLSFLDLDSSYVDRIMEMVLEEKMDHAKAGIQGPEEKAVAKLAITYGVLRRLGFSEHRVEECLKSISGTELEEAYDWLYLHCEEDELDREKVASDNDPKTPKTPKTPRTPRISRSVGRATGAAAASEIPPLPSSPIPIQAVLVSGSSVLAEPSHSKPPSRLSPMAPAFVPKFGGSLVPSPSLGEALLPSPAHDSPAWLSSSTTPSFPSSPSRSASPAPKSNGASLATSQPTIVDAAIEGARFSTSSASKASSSSVSAAISERESPEIGDPHEEYVRLKMQLDELTIRRQANENRGDDFISQLRKKLALIKNNYFFDEREAEGLYRIERRKADELALQDRLRGNTSATPSQAKSAKPSVNTETIGTGKHRPPDLLPSAIEPPNAVVDIFDEDADGDGGGLLQMLEEMPKTETGQDGTVITVKDMSLPKHWSGRTPKLLLQETVTKTDRYAIVTYSRIPGASRVSRASVSIRGDNIHNGEWRMEDVACYDLSQAEQYIATVALHALTFPLSEGFALGSTTTSSGQTSFRTLPAVYRDLWDELEETRKARDDANNRSIWAKLRTIIEPKLDLSLPSHDVKPKAVTTGLGMTSRRMMAPTSDLTADQIISSYEARRASAAYQSMLPQRNHLPIAAYKEQILMALETSQILVLSGETGCGKSTQLPSFILEDQLSRGHHCKIFCTEPRRISAISLAQRVSQELGDSPNAVGTNSSLIGYSIRLESNTSRSTRLTFVTNGIALRMLEGGSGEGGQGTAFDEITHIIIDEVHERSIESDFLLIVLKQLLEQRTDLKVVLMSATVDAEKISNFFGGCPTLKVPGRTYPVDVRYLEDAVELTKWTISENSPLARRAHDKYYRGKNRPEWSEDTAVASDEDDEASPQNVKLEKRYSPQTTTTINLLDERLIPYELIIRLLERICFEDPDYEFYSAAILIFMPGLGEIRRLNDLLSEHRRFGQSSTFVIYPLHSTISSEHQAAVFDVPSPGIRKIVIATNIAETGITIPDITCVIDTGKHKEMRFDEKRQISHLVETFVAKSNAAQRRGRAGRVQNGICFHLFTKLRHDTLMTDHPLPEMMRLSLSDLALRIKIMKVKLGSSIEDVLTRALDPPSAVNIQRAVSALVEVRALTTTEEITPMGRLLSKLPTDVHLGKFLLVAVLFRCLDPALTIAAALNSKSPFLSPFGHEDEADAKKAGFKLENSDFLTLHNAYCQWRSAASTTGGAVHKFCRTNFISHQNMQQIEELRQQFLGYLADSSFIQVSKSFVNELNRARYSRHRTRFVAVPPHLDSNSSNFTIINATLAAGLYPKILSVDNVGQMRTIANEKTVYFHPSSVNFGRKPTDFGINHLSYFTLMQSKRLYVWETGPVDDTALALLCSDPDFKLIANSVFLDRKVRFQVAPKANIALKHLRTHVNEILALRFQGQPLTESQVLWSELAEMVLGKIKIKDENEVDGMGPVVVVNNALRSR